MARLPRFSIPGVPQHVVFRGNDRQPIFRSENDRIFMHRMLVELTRKYDVSVHAYVFMTNHAHLAASQSEPKRISKVMQCLGRRYVQYFNRRYQRTGTLWEGRFKASLIQTEGYFLNCQKYIELNPVRAGVVPSPMDFRWSSFHANAWGVRDDLVTSHELVEAMGGTPQERQAAYREFFKIELAPETLDQIRDAIQNQWALGNDDFVAWVDSVKRPAKRAKAGRPRKRK